MNSSSGFNEPNYIRIANDDSKMTSLIEDLAADELREISLRFGQNGYILAKSCLALFAGGSGNGEIAKANSFEMFEELRRIEGIRIDYTKQEIFFFHLNNWYPFGIASGNFDPSSDILIDKIIYIGDFIHQEIIENECYIPTKDVLKKVIVGYCILNM